MTERMLVLKGCPHEGARIASDDMPLFRVSLPVQLDIEVDATDALTARRLIDDAFKRVDPLYSPNVRVQVKSSLGQLLAPACSMLLRKGLRSSLTQESVPK